MTSPPILVALWLMTAAACLALGLVCLMVWLRRHDAVSHLLLAAACLAAAGYTFTEVWLSRVVSVGEFVQAFRWANFFMSLTMIALSWFVVHYSGTARRWLVWAATIGWGTTVLLDAISPYGVTFSAITGIETRVTWWGEPHQVAVGTASMLKLIPDLSALAVLVLTIDAMVTTVRQRRPRRGLILGSVAFFLTAGLIQAVGVDLGLLPGPYLIGCLFLAIVAVITIDLTARVAESASLAEQLAVEQRRWQSVLQTVRLLVAGVDRHGCVDYVNPHFSTISGYEAGEVLGRRFTDLLPKDQRSRFADGFRIAMEGDVAPHVEVPLETRNGERRRILWSNVQLSDANGAPNGALSIGLDLTDQRHAEMDRDEAGRSLEAALRQLEELNARIHEENVYLKEEMGVDRVFANIIGQSDALTYVLHRVEQVADTDALVLIQGETGVGKELVARAVHQSSRRAGHPFVRVNCGALPSNLVESELFGHEKGAFTGADRLRRGRFEIAGRGTLFLDEIGELPLEVQVKLLRVLQDGEFERVGSSETITTDTRVIAATNRDLKADVEQGRFREDLFYRVNVYPITVPPLRQRREDIRLLVRHFVADLAERTGRSIEEIPGHVMLDLEAYDWPGNVRELQNVLERAVITSEGPVLHLPEALLSAEPDATTDQGSDVPGTLVQVERDHIAKVLELTRGQVAGTSGAAQILGLPPSTLRSRMKKLGVEPAVVETVAKSRRDISRSDDATPRTAAR